MKGFLLTLLAICIVAAPATAACQCRHFDDTNEKLPPGTIDDRGLRGPLERMTLDCLKFRGVIKRGKIWVALLQDDRGKLYRVTRGTYVGENSGRLDEITPGKVTITLLIPDGQGGWIEQKQYLFGNH
jgi:Tfp pilus assembly protein PilP